MTLHFPIPMWGAPSFIDLGVHTYVSTAMQAGTCRSLPHSRIMANVTRHYLSDRAVFPSSLSYQLQFLDCEVGVGFLRWHDFR
jgi:hypothetical protein